MNWTPAQSAAIETRGKDLLVSAAAGSGKTATLTERIIRSLKDTKNPADISKMLIVTFTRAAASELRMKIFKALSEALAKDPSNRHLAAQLIKTTSAKICTIDSFYLDMIRENFSSLGLPSNFRIADTAECELLAKECMADTVAKHYDADTDGFSSFAECFVGVRGGDRLPEILLSLYGSISAYPEGIDFLLECADRYTSSAECDFLKTSFGEVLAGGVEETFKYYADVLEDAAAYMTADEKLISCYLPSFSYDLRFCREAIEILRERSYERAKAHMQSYSPVPLKTIRGELPPEITLAKEKRTEITKAIRDLQKKSFSLSPEHISRAMLHSREITKRLYSLLSDFERTFSEEKLRRCALDFADIRRYALRLLVNKDGSSTEVAKNMSGKFTDIYIDEYQDVDRVQDMIFKSLSNGKNRFMVGDIKQSIYGFRGAEPHVFASYREKFPLHGTSAAEDSPCESIFMSNNFRCDENIIDFTNLVCSYLFGICSENIGYCKEDDLCFTKQKPSKDFVSQKVTLAIVTPPEDEESDYVSNADNNRASEARYIAAEISKLLKHGKLANGERVRPEDIAIMFRSSTIKPHIKAALEEAGIAYSGGEDNKYFESPDVLLVLSTLNVIDNPHRDIHLAATLYSPLFSFTLDDLVRIRKRDTTAHSLYDALCAYAEGEEDAVAEKCRDFLTTLAEWRELTNSMPVNKLLRRIFASRRFVITGISNSENLRILYEYARKFEAGAYRGLYDFIEYLNRMIANGTKLESVATDSTVGKVSLVTVHHSKGLEYPVCFLCGTSGQFNKNDFKDSMLFEYSTGVAMKLADGTGFARINTPMREAIISKLLATQIEEEMRVLYVALTRAREKLFVTGSSTKSADDLLATAAERRKYSGKHTVMRCHSSLDWILTALSGVDVSGICDVSFIDPTKIEDADVSTAPTESTKEEKAMSSELYEKLSTDFAYKYPYLHLARVPAKISVSRLSPDVLDEKDETLNLFDTDKKAAVPRILVADGADTPSPTARGTSTHLFLQFCNFARAKERGVEEEVARLIEERYIPEEARDEIFTEELERFFESDLYREISSAREVIREQRFNILLPSSDFSKDEEFIKATDEPLAVQGVIDLILIDDAGNVSVYDYKTDRLSLAERESDSALSKKLCTLHAEQLGYYKIAAERLFGKAPARVAVYSTAAAKTVDIF